MGTAAGLRSCVREEVIRAMVTIVRDKWGRAIPYKRCQCGRIVSLWLRYCPVCHRRVSEMGVKVE